MPLVKGGARGSDTSGDLTPQRPALDSSDAESRWAAARALAGHAEAVPELAAALGRETEPRVREATRLLCELIEREQHPNVCAAAIDVLAEVGTQEAIPVLKKCAVRFVGTPF